MRSLRAGTALGLLALVSVTAACSQGGTTDAAITLPRSPTVAATFGSGTVTVQPTTATPTVTPTVTKTPTATPTGTVAAEPSATRSTAKSPVPTTTKTTPKATSTAASSTYGMSKVEREVVALVNTERAKAGCKALKGDARLATAAGLHAQDMVKNQYFSHTSQDGRTPTDRAKAQGFPSGAGENIALGYADAKTVVQGWMESPGHKANILNCSYTVTGVGEDPGTALKGYSPGIWVQMFGTL